LDSRKLETTRGHRFKEARRHGATLPALLSTAVRPDPSDYPIDAAELARRLLGRELVPQGDARGSDRRFVDSVRALLRQYGCPREAGSHRPPYVVDEAMARRVADKLGMSLRLH
jgi:hypothetical protein